MKCSVLQKSFALTLFISTSGCITLDRNAKQDWGEGAANLSPAQPLNNAAGRYDHWQAIAHVHVEGGSVCSGSLIDTRGANDDRSGPAYVLTSGHCAKGDANRYIENAPASGVVTFNYFQDTLPRQKPYPIIAIEWSTMRGLDVAILKLDRSLAQLMSDGITPLKLAIEPLAVDSDVLVVGAPMDGHVQRAACLQEHRADVFEAGWAWPGQLSNRCRDVRPGISGSPVLNRYSNEIVAIVGTTTQGSGLSRCTRNAPCEVSNGDSIKIPETNYATSAVQLEQCFAATRFNPKNSACPLGRATNFEHVFGDVYIRLIRDANGELIPVRWTQSFTSDQPFYRVKHVRTLADCALDVGYGPVQPSHGDGSDSSSQELREGPGLYFMCVVGQPHNAGPAQRWDSRNAKIYYRWALAEPVKTPPAYRVLENTKDEFTVKPIGITPDLDVSRYQYKSGEPEIVDCQSSEGYKSVRPPLLDFKVSVGDGPKKVCLKTTDMAGNPSPISDFALPSQ
ncbi:serine protease [Pseudomonas chlororaphis]|uniref:trypsin-like serine peptidase n=1 Tax=Pseudomonas chlororaphis TaxID=587753 RepID=UPI0035D3E953